jgi:hypothetical protein
VAPARRTLVGLTALGLLTGAGACGGAPQVAKDVSRPRARGDAKDSLFRTSNLAGALERVRRHAGSASTVTSLRLEAGALTLVVQRRSAPESVVVTKQLDLTAVPAPPAADQPPVALSQIQPDAPERIAAAVRAQAGAGLRDIDFFALDREPGAAAPRWLVYLRSGRGTFAAGLSGDNVKPVKPMSTATTPGAATPPRTTTATSPTTTTTTPRAAPTTPAPEGRPPTALRPPRACLRLPAQQRAKTPGCEPPTNR